MTTGKVPLKLQYKAESYTAKMCHNQWTDF